MARRYADATLRGIAAQTPTDFTVR